MPKRQRIIRVETEEVQGEDSWVNITHPTWGETKALLKLQQRDDADSVELGEKVLREHVVAWNWVDDNGDPLPQPTESGAFDLLTTQEINFLTDAMAGALSSKN